MVIGVRLAEIGPIVGLLIIVSRRTTIELHGWFTMIVIARIETVVVVVACDGLQFEIGALEELLPWLVRWPTVLIVLVGNLSLVMVLIHVGVSHGHRMAIATRIRTIQIAAKSFIGWHDRWERSFHGSTWIEIASLHGWCLKRDVSWPGKQSTMSAVCVMSRHEVVS